MHKHILAAEITHENAPPYICQMLTGREQALLSAVNKSKFPLDEVLIHSANGRFIVYGVGTAIDPFLNFFLQDPRLFNYVQFYKNTEASVNHIFATACGLFSPLKGEQGILAELESSLKKAREAGTSGLVLDSLVSKALVVGKQVRTQTGIDTFGASVIDNGIDIIYREMADVFNRNMLVIGTGKLSELTIESLVREGITNISLTGEDMNRAWILCRKYNITPVPFSDLANAIKKADIVFGTAGFSAPWSDNELLQMVDVFPARKIFIDLSSPLCFPTALRQLKKIKLLNLDELKRMQANPLDLFGGTDEAWKIIAEQAREFEKYFNQLQNVPVLTACWRNLKYKGRVVAESVTGKGDKARTAGSLICSDKRIGSLLEFPALACTAKMQSQILSMPLFEEEGNLPLDVNERQN